MKTILFVFSLFTSLVVIGQTQDDYHDYLSTLYSNAVPLVKPSSVKVDTNVVILDTREKSEYTISHIPGAIWVGYDSFKIKEVLSTVSKDKKVIVYCTVGWRSEKIGEKLLKKGYSDVSNIYGGIIEWSNAGRELEDSNGTATQKVHTWSEEFKKYLKNGSATY